jgi:hypothetical protein
VLLGVVAVPFVMPVPVDVPVVPPAPMLLVAPVPLVPVLVPCARAAPPNARAAAAARAERVREVAFIPDPSYVSCCVVDSAPAATPARDYGGDAGRGFQVVAAPMRM